MAGHGSPPAEDKANHPGRKVGRDTSVQASVQNSADALSDQDFITQYGMISRTGEVRTPPWLKEKG